MARINKQTAKLATQLKEAWGRPEEGMRVGIVIGEIRDGLVQQYITSDDYFITDPGRVSSIPPGVTAGLNTGYGFTVLSEVPWKKWWNHLVDFGLNGQPFHFTLISHDEDDDGAERNSKVEITLRLADLGLWAEPFSRFVQRGLTRKSGDKLIKDTLGSMKTSASSRARFVEFMHLQLGKLTVALNQPARLTLGLMNGHCLGRITGSDPNEYSVAIMMEDRCIFYYVCESSQYLDNYSEFHGPRNSECRVFSDYEKAELIRVVAHYLPYVTHEYAELLPHEHFMLSMDNDLRILENWRKRSWKIDHFSGQPVISRVYVIPEYEFELPITSITVEAESSDKAEFMFTFKGVEDYCYVSTTSTTILSVYWSRKHIVKNALSFDEETKYKKIAVDWVKGYLKELYSEERYPDLPLKGTGRYTHSRHALAARYNPKRLN